MPPILTDKLWGFAITKRCKYDNVFDFGIPNPSYKSNHQKCFKNKIGKNLTQQKTTVVNSIEIEYVFENSDIVRVFAEPFAHNVASCKVLEKAGFQGDGFCAMSSSVEQLSIWKCIRY